jgi:hypothetical protein
MFTGTITPRLRFFPRMLISLGLTLSLMVGFAQPASAHMDKYCGTGSRNSFGYLYLVEFVSKRYYKGVLEHKVRATNRITQNVHYDYWVC